MRVDHRQKASKFFNSILPVIIIIETIVLISRVSGLHNSELLINAGTKIVDKSNPYEPYQPYGTPPALIYWMFHKLTFHTQNPAFFILLNLLGVILVLHFLFPNLSNFSKQKITVLILLTSPIRALVANVQHTGIILGCLLLGYYFTKQHFNRKYLSPNLIGSIFFLISLEIKPQIALPFILIFIIMNRNFRLFIIISAELIFFRLIIDLWVGRILELEQFRVWKIMQNDNLTISEQTSMWKLLEKYFPNTLNWFQLSFILYIVAVLLLIFIAININNDLILKLALFIPLFTAYLHLYDLVVLAIVISFLVIQSISKFGAVIILGLIILPARFHSPAELANGLVFIFALILIFTNLLIEKKYRILGSKILESVVVLIFIKELAVTGLTLEEKVSVQISVIFIFGLLYFGQYIYKNRLSEKSILTLSYLKNRK